MAWIIGVDLEHRELPVVPVIEYKRARVTPGRVVGNGDLSDEDEVASTRFLRDVQATPQDLGHVDRSDLLHDSIVPPLGITYTSSLLSGSRELNPA
jgi:hypothetical protein